jgi:hypothetical protein
MAMKRLYEAIQSEFNAELPTKEKMAFNLMDGTEKKQHNAIKMNQKAMMQLALSFNNFSMLNKLNCKNSGTRSMGQLERPITTCQ